MASMYPPKKNTAFTLYLTIRDADGDLVSGATGLDSEVSIDGGNFADCTNEATEIQSTGIYSLSVTSGEMNGDVIVIQTKTTSSGAKTAVNIMYTTARLHDDLAFPTTTGRSIDVTATGEVGIDWANVGGPTTTLNLSGTTVAAVSGAVGSVTGNIGGSVASLTTNNDKTGYALSTAGIDALFVRQLVEAYAADGVAPTVAQALLLILQVLTEFSRSSTTVTVKKLDGATSAATLTLDSATAPTSVTRAT